MVTRGGGGGAGAVLSRYPNGVARGGWEAWRCKFKGTGGGDTEGLVARVDAEEFDGLVSPSPGEEVDPLDSTEVCRSWRSLVGPGSGSTRRRPLGDGPSIPEESMGPRRKLATARDARSYLRSSASSSLRRLPLLVPGTMTARFPLLFAGATSLRLVNEPSALGGSMSTSTSLERSTMTSPLMAHPAVP